MCTVKRGDLHQHKNVFFSLYDLHFYIITLDSLHHRADLYQTISYLIFYDTYSINSNFIG